ncbi:MULTISPECIES: carbon storage regulator [unclassified Thioalkalivibrio]|uniref:carbon storage regulator n=1 Tax=unclassified Thioalkalivibrio TaxID=2621013 RepID=UPI00036208B5|nr:MULTISPECIES: carbon storage regulator [unclassified Thioalkalivibrio]
MLVLTLKDGEALYVGDSALVVAVQTQEAPLRLSACAPGLNVEWDTAGSRITLHHPDGPVRMEYVDHRKARLGIEAPESVDIVREALRERRQSSQEISAPSQTE